MSKFHFPEENTLKTLVAQYVARRGAVFFVPIKFPGSSLSNVARATLPAFSRTQRSVDGDDRWGSCGIFAVVANRWCQDSVGIDPSRGTEATQPADYRRAQEGASPPKVQEGHV